MRKLRAVILTEGGQKIGFGHITRCLALKDALRAKKAHAVLIVHGDASVKRHFQKQIDVITNWLSREKTLCRFTRRADIVVIDSYLAPLRVYQRIAAKVPLAVYLDDFLRLRYPKGIIVNGAIAAETFKYPRMEKTEYRLGASYALLRRTFWKIPARVHRKRIRSVLVTFGGIVRADFNQGIIRFLSDRFPQWDFYFITPQKRLFDAASGFKNVHLRYDLTAEKIKNLMKRCDVAISGCGQTTNELAASGIPSVGIGFAANQRLNIAGWQKKDFLKYAGPYHDPKIFQKIEMILRRLSYRTRQHMGRCGQTIVDGRGALRLASIILKAGEKNHVR